MSEKRKGFFNGWSFLDVVTFNLMLVAGILAVVIGSENLHAVLMASQLPVFLEPGGEVKARWISLTLPLAALALKSPTSRLQLDAHRNDRRLGAAGHGDRDGGEADRRVRPERRRHRRGVR